MMDAEERSICAELFGGDCQVDGLQKHICCRACPRMRRIGPVAKRKKANFFHGNFNRRRANAGSQGGSRISMLRLCDDLTGFCDVYAVPVRSSQNPALASRCEALIW